MHSEQVASDSRDRSAADSPLDLPPGTATLVHVR